MFLFYNTFISVLMAIILLLIAQQRFGWNSFLGRSGGLALLSILTSFVLLSYLTISNSLYLFSHPSDFVVWLTAIIPFSIFLGLIGYLSYGDYKLNKETEERNKKLENKKQECLQWAKQFEFIDSPEKCHTSIYMSKNVVVGRLTLVCENEEQKKRVQSNTAGLPSDIYLNIVKESMLSSYTLEKMKNKEKLRVESH